MADVFSDPKTLTDRLDAATVALQVQDGAGAFDMTLIHGLLAEMKAALPPADPPA